MGLSRAVMRLLYFYLYLYNLWKWLPRGTQVKTKWLAITALDDKPEENKFLSGCGRDERNYFLYLP
jgi:hypothetical protein